MLLNSIDDVPASLEEADQNAELYGRRSRVLIDECYEMFDLGGPLFV